MKAVYIGQLAEELNILKKSLEPNLSIDHLTGMEQLSNKTTHDLIVFISFQYYKKALVSSVEKLDIPRLGLFIVATNFKKQEMVEIQNIEQINAALKLPIKWSFFKELIDEFQQEDTSLTKTGVDEQEPSSDEESLSLDTSLIFDTDMDDDQDEEATRVKGAQDEETSSELELGEYDELLLDDGKESHDLEDATRVLSRSDEDTEEDSEQNAMDFSNEDHTRIEGIELSSEGADSDVGEHTQAEIDVLFSQQDQSHSQLDIDNLDLDEAQEEESFLDDNTQTGITLVEDDFADLDLESHNNKLDSDFQSLEDELSDLDSTLVNLKVKQREPIDSSKVDDLSTQARGQLDELNELIDDNHNSVEIEDFDFEQPPTRQTESHSLFAESISKGDIHNQDILKKLNYLERENLHLRESLLQMQDSKSYDHLDPLSSKLELNEKSLEIRHLKSNYEKKIQGLLNQVDYLKDEKSLLEEKIDFYQKELEVLGQKVRLDLGKVRAREHELENQVELLKIDNEVQVKNRDQKIIDLKRKIDALEFSMESMLRNEEKIKASEHELERKMNRIVSNLREAIRFAEDDEDLFIKRHYKSTKNN